MRRICIEVEAFIDYESLLLGMRVNTLVNFSTASGVESVCSAAVKATIGSSCSLIIVRKLHPAAPVRPGDDGHRHCFLRRHKLVDHEGWHFGCPWRQRERASYNTFSTQDHAAAEQIAKAGTSTAWRGKERPLPEYLVVHKASRDRA